MPSGDSRNQRQQPPADGEQPSGRPAEGDQRSGKPGREQDVDFGSYVSSTVRSSAELFGTTGRSSRSRKSKPIDSTPSAPPESPNPDRPVSQPPPERVASARDVTRRSGRYWREAVVEEDVVDDYVEPPVANVAGGGGAMDTIRGRFPWAFDDGGRLKVPVLGGLAALALLLLLVIWVAVQGDDPDDDGNATETPAVVIGAPTENATSASDDSTPSGFVPVPTMGPETDVTPTPQRGGDNQRNRDQDETPEANGGDPLAGIELGPVASGCPERCLVRFTATGDVERLMTEARTRASFAADGFYWAVAEPEGIAWIESQAETTMVATSADTLGLYIARVPPEETNDDRVAGFGEVLDAAGDWRLVRAASVPANVRPLTDWGYEVSKVAPAPPSDIAVIDEPTDIASIEIGSLIDEVSEGNIESSITDLVAMGSSDGSAVGTRYYTTAANMRAAEYLYTRLESYGLEVWYEDFLTWEGFLVVNVIGEVPGRDTSAIYGVMAHFDTIADDTNVSPGADDNASGVAASLEIARILTEHDLVHPVRIIFVNVEEVGIVGSQKFAENAAANDVPYEGVFNLDSIGAQRQYSYMVVNGGSTTGWMVDMYKRLNEAYGLNQTINAMNNEAIRADDNRLRDEGIDSIMIGRELYGQSPYHHTSGDLIETISIPSVAKAGALTLLCLANLAQG